MIKLTAFWALISMSVFIMAPPSLAQATRVNVLHSVVNVAVTSTQVAAKSSGRSFLLLVNDSDTEIYCTIGVAATLNGGIRINADGGSFEMSRGIKNIDTRVVNCIHGGTGTKTLLVTEG